MTKERKEYLENLASDYNIDTFTVFMLASTLGESEDYDGLISSLEDIVFMLALDDYDNLVKEGIDND